MIVHPVNPAWLREMLAREIKAQIAAELAKIADDAAEQARRAVMAQADKLALRLLTHYSVEMRGDHVIIEVRKVEGKE